MWLLLVWFVCNWFFFVGNFCLFVVIGMCDFAEELAVSGSNLESKQKGCQEKERDVV